MDILDSLVLVAVIAILFFSVASVRLRNDKRRSIFWVGLVVSFVAVGVISSTETAQWKAAKRRNTEEAYQRYLRKFPDSNRISPQRRRMLLEKENRLVDKESIRLQERLEKEESSKPMSHVAFDRNLKSSGPFHAPFFVVYRDSKKYSLTSGRSFFASVPLTTDDIAEATSIAIVRSSQTQLGQWSNGEKRFSYTVEVVLVDAGNHDRKRYAMANTKPATKYTTSTRRGVIETSGDGTYMIDGKSREWGPVGRSAILATMLEQIDKH